MSTSAQAQTGKRFSWSAAKGSFVIQGRVVIQYHTALRKISALILQLAHTYEVVGSDGFSPFHWVVTCKSRVWELGKATVLGPLKQPLLDIFATPKTGFPSAHPSLVQISGGGTHHFTCKEALRQESDQPTLWKTEHCLSFHLKMASLCHVCSTKLASYQASYYSGVRAGKRGCVHNKL